MAEGPVHPAWNHEALISPWMGQGAGASRLLRRKVSELSMTTDVPADASGAAWPAPQTNDETFPGGGHLCLPTDELLSLTQ